jgi:hypothetical protein
MARTRLLHPGRNRGTISLEANVSRIGHDAGTVVKTGNLPMCSLAASACAAAPWGLTLQVSGTFAR